MSNITTTNRQGILDLIAAADESAEISQLTEYIVISDEETSITLIADDGELNVGQIDVGPTSISIQTTDGDQSAGLTIGGPFFYGIRLGGLQSFASDAAAGAAGVPSGGLYKHTSGNHTAVYIKD